MQTRVATRHGAHTHRSLRRISSTTLSHKRHAVSNRLQTSMHSDARWVNMATRPQAVSNRLQTTVRLCAPLSPPRPSLASSSAPPPARRCAHLTERATTVPHHRHRRRRIAETLCAPHFLAERVNMATLHARVILLVLSTRFGARFKRFANECPCEFIIDLWHQSACSRLTRLICKRAWSGGIFSKRAWI